MLLATRRGKHQQRWDTALIHGGDKRARRASFWLRVVMRSPKNTEIRAGRQTSEATQDAQHEQSNDQSPGTEPARQVDGTAGPLRAASVGSKPATASLDYQGQRVEEYPSHLTNHRGNPATTQTQIPPTPTSIEGGGGLGGHERPLGLS